LARLEQVGVKIVDQFGTTLAQTGIIASADGEPMIVNQEGKLVPVRGLTGLFWHKFPLSFTFNNETNDVGEVTIYSSSKVVFHKVKMGFLFIIINSIIKTVVLWVLFLWIANSLLSQPLSNLTTSIGKMCMDNIDGVKVDIKTKGRNELKILEEAFNSMTKNLSEAYQKLKIAMHEVKAAAKMKSEFLANTTHELKTPMNAIIGFTKVLLTTKTTKEQDKYLQKIDQSSKSLMGIINSILDYSKIDIDNTKIDSIDFNLEGLLKKMYIDASQKAEEKGLEALFDIETKCSYW